MTQLQPHIRLSREMTHARYALLPGDPKRVEHVAQFLENVEDFGSNREYRALRGWFRGVEVLVMSTGMGGPSTAIAVEELRQIGVTNLIRIGSCGAMQNHIRLGDLVIATAAVRDDGTSNMYIAKGYPACADIGLVHHLAQQAKRLGYASHCGYVRSHDSFYTEREDEINQFWSGKGILAADMETAPLMVVGALRGLRIASVLNVVVEHSGNLEEGINNYQQQEQSCLQGESREILLALEALYLDSQEQ
ncbi:nucleoside phosphorylase [Cedecea neteri]|uniref:Uridine phosphorylase n=1 Tax=Cedecea neteri TaxID=158822 RepID=A0A291DT88_9ENTR|nr:nucleoside phosphorylase [Cedecea neteri]ATF90991.1 uridine phosphorylase [Cedecea neteri]